MTNRELGNAIRISTHTLTWSVTYIILCLRQAYNFNSHAHVERDAMLLRYVAYHINFNSHAHVERDLERFVPF